MKMFLVTIVSLIGFSAFAQSGPQIEPGPIVKLGDTAAEVVDALALAKPADLKLFIKSGNVTKTVSRQVRQPEVTVYTFTRQQCNLGGITGGMCLGGAVLQVVVTEKQEGSMLVINATSSVSLIK